MRTGSRLGQTEDRRRVAWYAEAVGVISRCGTAGGVIPRRGKPRLTLRQRRGSEFASFASTHTTHAERHAARQSSFTRTTNATTPQVYPLLRRSSARPRSRPRARRGGFEERRLEVKDSGRRKMNLILMWSWRWRRRRPMSPRRRHHDQARLYAPREGAAAVSRRRRLRRAGRRLQARARRTVASTSTRKPPVSRSSTHGYVLTTSALCGTRAWLVVWERHAPKSYGLLVAVTGGCSCEEPGIQWRDSGCIGSRVRFRRLRLRRCVRDSLREGAVHGLRQRPRWEGR